VNRGARDRDPSRRPKDWAGTAQTLGFQRFLGFVERAGNLLPHPVTLFALFALGVVLLSGLAGALQWSVPDPRPAGMVGRAASGEIAAVSLLNGEGLRRILDNLVVNFTGFVPLGTVLVALLGIGVAERSGLLSAMLRGLVLRTPPRWITGAVVLGGVLSNTAAEMGYVVLIPLAAVLYHALGRHPLAGLAAAFAGVSAGYSANLLIGTVDPLLAGITQEAARLIDPEYTVHPAVNWYFMAASTFVITGVGWAVSDHIVEPRLGAYRPAPELEGSLPQASAAPLDPLERRGLWAAGVTLLALISLLLLTTLPEGGALRNPETGGLLDSSLLRGLVALILVFFLVPGAVYGRVTGTLRSDRDVVDAMTASMSTMGLYIVLVFFAAQFVAFFGWSNLGSLSAVWGANALQSLGLTGPSLFALFILMCGVVNLALGSASAQWAVTAPIFVPMLMLTGYAPEVVQAAYRIGDSVTNVITPMMSYFGLILASAARYDRKLGIGTLVAMMLPYSLFFLLTWTALFFLWVFGLGLPVGPGTATYYP
jgi:aminobenzoyl-glutamate transport protein